jgi:hypothetical protein
MKTTVMCTLVSLTALGAGFGGGWLVWGRRGEAAPQTETVAKKLVKDPAAQTATPTPQAPEDDTAHAAEVVATELERIKKMSMKEFSIRMADAWLDYGHPDSHIRRALYLSACDGERATAFYLEFKHRKGLTLQQESPLREFFTMVAKRDGKEFLSEIMSVSPGGVCEIDSLIHGWASASPGEAVEWLNSLPEHSPLYTQSLKGLIWGLAENSPAGALKVFQQLGPSDRNKDTLWGLTSSTVMNHGLKGLTELVAGITDQSQKQQFLMAAMDYGMREPPGEFVKSLARSLEEAPALKGNYNFMATRWTTAAPKEAMAWLGQNGLKSDAPAALAMVTSGLVRNGRTLEVENWLAENPGAPGYIAIETAMREAQVGKH